MSKNLPILLDACARLPHQARAMFGGHGLFAPNGGMFAGIVDEDRIILKFSDTTAREELKTLGGEAWTYTGQARPMTMQEWILIPDGFYDDQEALAQWAHRAHQLVPPKGAKKQKALGVKKARAAAAPRKTAAKSAAKTVSKTAAPSGKKVAAPRKKARPRGRK